MSEAMLFAIDASDLADAGTAAELVDHWRDSRKALRCIIRLAAPRRWRPLSSNVRLHTMHRCYVCGWELSEAPWGETGLDPTWAICACCGCEFGYQDCQPSAILAHRKRWLESGAQWHDLKDKPLNWSLETQLSQVPTTLAPGMLRGGGA